MTLSQVYWLTRLPQFEIYFIILAVLSGGAALFVFCVEEGRLVLGSILFLLFFSILFGAVSCLMPTNRDLIAMYGISFVTSNKSIETLTPNGAKALNVYLNKYINEKNK